MMKGRGAAAPPRCRKTIEQPAGGYEGGRRGGGRGRGEEGGEKEIPTAFS